MSCQTSNTKSSRFYHLKEVHVIKNWLCAGGDFSVFSDSGNMSLTRHYVNRWLFIFSLEASNGTIISNRPPRAEP
jgi:hypothetical protein